MEVVIRVFNISFYFYYLFKYFYLIVYKSTNDIANSLTFNRLIKYNSLNKVLKL
jgi:hypothetical protein